MNRNRSGSIPCVLIVDVIKSRCEEEEEEGSFIGFISTFSVSTFSDIFGSDDGRSASSFTGLTPLSTGLSGFIDLIDLKACCFCVTMDGLNGLIAGDEDEDEDEEEDDDEKGETVRSRNTLRIVPSMVYI